MALLEIADLHLHMKSFDGEAHVLNGIRLNVEKGEIWGLVGETGCGKSLTGLSIARLLQEPPARYSSGTLTFDGMDILASDEHAMRTLRGRRIGMIFQDPTTNLNPAFRVIDQLTDVALHAARDIAAAPRRERRQLARALSLQMLHKVGIPDAEIRASDYPHQFSGGMRQRVLIAMALMGRPDLLIADEPTTALDVSVQAQILELIRSLAEENQTAVLLITHNLGVVADTCSHVAVMYAGNIVESGPCNEVLAYRQHPYTRALLESIPDQAKGRGALQGIAGQIPDLFSPPLGCRFAARCRLAQDICRTENPPLIASNGNCAVACHFPLGEAS